MIKGKVACDLPQIFDRNIRAEKADRERNDRESGSERKCIRYRQKSGRRFVKRVQSIIITRANRQRINMRFQNNENMCES